MTHDRAQFAIESGLTYDGSTAVELHVEKRGGRYKVSDEGRAVAAAGASGVARYPDSIRLGEHSVNVSRQGVVWLPAVRPSGAWLATVCDLVARGSVALYERLLELDEDRAFPGVPKRHGSPARRPGLQAFR
jgi:hypothetical protein